MDDKGEGWMNRVGVGDEGWVMRVSLYAVTVYTTNDRCVKIPSEEHKSSRGNLIESSQTTKKTTKKKFYMKIF